MPKKWTDVYNQGTKEGDEEQKFFICLARHPKYTFRSASAIAKETGLPRKRVDELVQKYLKMGLIYPHPSNEDTWGYWERNPELANEDNRSITKKDQDKRIEKHLGF
jgi:saccharopine dehydrogenase-like NADP-dependent oxidoreductase